MRVARPVHELVIHEELGIYLSREVKERMSYIMPSLFGVFLLGSLLGGPLQRPSPFIDRKVAERQVLGPDWTEIKLDQPVKPVGDYQQIGLTLAPPLELDLLGPLGVRVSNGSLILPEVELLTADNVTMRTKCSGSRGKTTLTYRLKDESVKQDYNRIRIRADQEIRLKAIYWTGIVIKNMP